MRLAYAFAVLASAALPACVITWGDDPDPPCAYAAADIAPDPGQVNPYNLTCEYFGNSYPYPCDDECGPCPLAGAEDVGALPSWGSCASTCRTLDEYTCGNTAGCRTTYDDYCLNGGGPCTAEVAFLGCQPVDQYPAANPGGCQGLDAWECSRHDDCLSTFRTGRDTVEFQACQPELIRRCGIGSDCA